MPVNENKYYRSLHAVPNHTITHEIDTPNFVYLLRRIKGRLTDQAIAVFPFVPYSAPKLNKCGELAYDSTAYQICAGR